MNLQELNKIGLTHEGSKNTAEKLNELLANYQIFYMNVRGLHWNIKGKDFFVLHEKFEELYNGSLENIDEVAERILTLGVTPLHSYKVYTKISKIEEVENVFDSVAAVNTVLDGLRQLLIIEREILAVASEINDEGTVSLMSDYITEQEKLVWMFSAVVAK
ncbi:Dps family protein [Galbibacter orientalis]|uniref:DNA-binding ferritin-like protein (Oxidative damage protectant) n=1 Tax=Galbibacter orientalis DSM 19592 TaxID=926559 RepID=I3C8P1_9FLAO|nr:DNA starvation/stationary phase protection protein [Galbibacter orientalis]EIJ39984.1 DNA-binding ferritin-like protein (oxidative damage protectant) [Galbibacter orientalis DSM 19592]